jgi:hypothetical protein
MPLFWMIDSLGICLPACLVAGCLLSIDSRCFCQRWRLEFSALHLLYLLIYL